MLCEVGNCMNEVGIFPISTMTDPIPMIAMCEEHIAKFKEVALIVPYPKWVDGGVDPKHTKK